MSSTYTVTVTTTVTTATTMDVLAGSEYEAASIGYEKVMNGVESDAVSSVSESVDDGDTLVSVLPLD